LFIRNISILLIIVIISVSCSDKYSEKDYVTIAIRSDVESLNPLYAFQPHEGSITELLFLALVRHEWNSEKGSLDSYPMLAEKLEWRHENSVLYIKIREDVIWSDSTKVSVDDIMFSFEVYSDPDIQSRALGFFENYFTDKAGKIIPSKSFNRISDSELEIKFRPGTKPDYLDVDQPLIPKHIFEGLKKEQYMQVDFNVHPVSNGPFKLVSWEKDQAIILEKNSGSFMINDDTPGRLIFKVIPDYNSRLLQLQKEEIDILSDLKPEDAEELKSNDDIVIGVIGGREYDYIGWNNLDPKKYNDENRVVPNPIFAEPEVRVAITYALNRQEVLDNFLYNYGQLADGPISSIFINAFDTSIKSYEYNAGKAQQLLDDEGWKDSNGDGIREKNGKELKFKLMIPSGNLRRKFAATIFSNNLQEIGIGIEVEFLEMNTFMEGLFNKRFDAWMVGWQIPLPINLRIQWYSDLSTTPVNFSSYNNNKVDSLLDLSDLTNSEKEKNELFRQINKIIYNEQPYTFLYWIDNIIAYNKRIKNIVVNPLGAVHNCWEWKID
jgi:peptide/nickel transport system substrate-binding protein